MATLYQTYADSLGPVLSMPLTTTTNDARSSYQDRVEGFTALYSGSGSGDGGIYAPPLLVEATAEPCTRFGTSSYITVNGKGNAGGTSKTFSISFIIMKENFSQENYVGIMGGGTWYMQSLFNKLVVMDYTTASTTSLDGNNIVVSSNCLEDMVPHHVVMTCEEIGGGSTSLVSLYVDGVLVGTSTETALSTTQPTEYLKYIGCMTPSYYVGHSSNHAWMQEVNKWDRALTPTEITKLAYYAKFAVPPVTLAGTVVEGYLADLFRVRMHRLDTGELVREVTTTGSFSETVPDLEYYVVVNAEQGDVWKPGIIHALGDKVYPTNPTEIRYYFVCTTAGTTGETEPVWDVLEGSTTTDNTVVWTVVEPLIQPITHAPVRGV